MVLKVREARGPVRRRLVWVAYGITRSGRRELIGYRLAAGESEVAWTVFLQELFLRGFGLHVLRDLRRRVFEVRLIAHPCRPPAP